MKNQVWIVILIGAISVFGDTIYLKNGNTVEGIIIKKDSSSVTLNINIGEMTFYKDEVLKIVKTNDDHAIKDKWKKEDRMNEKNFKDWNKKNKINSANQKYRLKKVKLYSTERCGYCKKAKALFEASKIPYEEFDVEKSGSARAEYDKIASEHGGVPVIVIGDKVIHGYALQEIKSALNLSSAWEPVP
jgi:glutaredoxin